MKIGFVTTAHYSDEYRPKGNFFLTRFCESIDEHCSYDNTVYVVDNGSVKTLDEHDNTTVIRIEDQTVGGITHAWNVGINEAFRDGCDVVFNCNDDLWFNITINMLIDYIKENRSEDSLYSAISNGILDGPQKAKQAGEGVFTMKCNGWNNCLNGFFFGMTKEHYEKYKFSEDKYFDKHNKHNGGDGKWGGQEGQFIVNANIGMKAEIVRSCFVHHDKLRGWKHLVGK